jgi:hypothetical protein
LKNDILKQRRGSRRLKIDHDRNMGYPLFSLEFKEGLSQLNAERSEKV